MSLFKGDANGQYWLGAVRDRTDPKTWRWIGGKPVSVSFWNLPGGDDDCARFDGTKGWLWSDTNCGLKLNYICQHRESMTFSTIAAVCIYLNTISALNSIDKATCKKNATPLQAQRRAASRSSLPTRRCWLPTASVSDHASSTTATTGTSWSAPPGGPASRRDSTPSSRRSADVSFKRDLLTRFKRKGYVAWCTTYNFLDNMVQVFGGGGTNCQFCTCHPA